MAVHEHGVAEGDRQQEAAAERAEDLAPTHSPDRRSQPGCEANEGTDADEEIGRTKQVPTEAVAAAPDGVHASVPVQALHGEPPRQREGCAGSERRAARLALLDQCLHRLSRVLLPSLESVPRSECMYGEVRGWPA
jgi:hypothetical protein